MSKKTVAPDAPGVLELERTLRGLDDLEAVRQALHAQTGEGAALTSSIEELALWLAKMEGGSRILAAVLELAESVTIGKPAPREVRTARGYERAHQRTELEDEPIGEKDQIVQVMCLAALNGLNQRDLIINPVEIIKVINIRDVSADEARAILARGTARLNHAWSSTPNKVL